MKKFGFVIISILFSLLAISIECNASDQGELLAKIKKLKTLSTNFHESIIDEDGLELEKYEGILKLDVAQKSFRLETLKPEQNTIVCNGKDLYSFDPNVAQVTIFNFNKVAQNSPFWLLIDPNEYTLAKFKISKVNDLSFDILNQEQSISYNVSFDQEGLAAVKYIDQNKQTISYSFLDRDFAYNTVAEDFTFKIPEGVTVDDQR